MNLIFGLLCPPFITSDELNMSHHVEQFVVMGMPLLIFIAVETGPLLIFIAVETGVCMPLPSKLTSASAAILAFRPCLPSRCLAGSYASHYV
jgi:hypothetical protein